MVARLVDVLLATLIVGLAAVGYGALMSGSFNVTILFIVPLALFWSLLLGATSIFMHLPGISLLALITATVVLVIAAMRIGLRPVRVIAISMVLGGQALGSAWLMSVLGITA